eukprot:gene45638-56864_t
MQKQGTITRWDSTRAFGFIRSPGGTADVFFHLKDFRSATPPREGMAVVYDDVHVGGKGPRAVGVRPAGAAAGAPIHPPPPGKPRGSNHPQPAASKPPASRHAARAATVSHTAPRPSPRAHAGGGRTAAGASSGCIWADNARNWLKLPDAAVADMAAGAAAMPRPNRRVVSTSSATTIQ